MSFGFLRRITATGISAAKKSAGDLVKDAKPSIKPVNMAISSLKVVAVTRLKNKVHIPKHVNIESTRAILSKNRDKGENAQRMEAKIADIFDLKI